MTVVLFTARCFRTRALVAARFCSSRELTSEGTRDSIFALSRYLYILVKTVFQLIIMFELNYNRTWR